MPVQALTAAPATKNDAPSIVLNHSTPDPIHLICTVRSSSTSGDQEQEDVETACNPGGEAPGAVTETLNLQLLWSHGALGTYNVLKPFEFQLVPFAWLLNGGAVNSVDNPELSGQCYVPYIPFLDSAIAKYSYIDLEFRMSGRPLTTTAGVPVYAGHTGVI